MKINEPSFKAIQAGKKTIEVRLNDKKRQLLKVGDSIEFSKLPDLREKIQVQVSKLERFKTFKELIGRYPMEKHSSKPEQTKEECLNNFYKLYPKEEEEQFGVLAIHIKLA